MQEFHLLPDQVRTPAVAGAFYPDNPARLGQLVDSLLKAARGKPPAPKAMIVPHAGYRYSGPVAASAFVNLPRDTGRIVLIGPSHHFSFHGVAISQAAGFQTPLGVVPVDEKALRRIALLSQVQISDQAHRHEHSLEVMLPFLQKVLAHFTLVPLVAGSASETEIGEVLEQLWDGAETRLIVSSDLSHYSEYDQAVRLDRATAEAIRKLSPDQIGPDDACGWVPVRGLLWCARQHKLKAEILDLRNSGDTAGPRDRVVGYGAFAFGEQPH